MLEVKQLCKIIRQSGMGMVLPARVLADNLSLRVAPGEVMAVLGPSGCGKSTLLKIIAGLEPFDSGSICFNSVDLARTPPHQRGFALMFQNFALFPHLDVLDNVAFGLIERGLPQRNARQQALQMLHRFGLGSAATQKVWTLSGGEQQRAALARTLITEPHLLLLDEPFSALDAHLRVQLRQEFSQHIAQAGIPTLLVTHDEQEARTMAGSGCRLQDGHLKKLW